MAEIIYKEKLEDFIFNPENKIMMGDYIYCKACGETNASFWGIYAGEKDGVIDLMGGSSAYLPKTDLYLNVVYHPWVITKRIKNSRVKITIEEKFINV
jgi:hypothetical protein